MKNNKQIFYLIITTIILFSCSKKEEHQDALISILKPIEGMMLHKGNSYEIKWKGSLTDSRITINLLKDDDLYLNIANNLENTGIYTWNIPEELETSYRYKLEVYSNLEAYNKIYTADFIIMEKPETSTFTDPRDGQVYKTVKLGNQWWMAENFNYETENGSMCYLNESQNCLKRGKLYTLEAAVACAPEGWHLPTDAEWQELERFLGIPENDLDETGFRGYRQGLLLWPGGGSGFDALLGGYYNNMFGKYGHIEYEARFWSSTQVNGEGSYWIRLLHKNHYNIDRFKENELFANSVRLVKD